MRKLESIVEDIQQIDISDEQRFDLICRFFETDEATFERSDDSSGFIGDVYKTFATSVFNACIARTAKNNQSQVADELELLVALNDKLGDTDARDRIARSEFDRAPSAHALEVLLDVVGQDERSAIIAEQRDSIFSQSEFSDTSLAFLIETDSLELAADYVVLHRDTINGDFYWNLPKYASQFLKAGYSVAAICLYRALLDSVLRRGKTKTYPYGIKYLIALDRLSDVVLLKGMKDHGAYKRGILAVHGKKYSFWRKYEASCS